MGFEDYVEALAQVIRHSPARFAVGVFGQWGGGKTTVMKAVQQELGADEGIIPIRFNAWRYEREEHLIIPMLDVLRDTLAAWSPKEAAEPTGADREKATLIRTLARSARALAAGLSIKAGLPGALEASWEATKVIEDWQGNRPDNGNGNRPDDGPQSVYHASFSALERASRDFLTDGRRFIVFVDDLDRCLPHAALQVLESMKLFFDLRGFVFVVGLDRTVIERAVHITYPASPDAPAGPGAPSYVSGTDYVKKIFQVQFNLPTLRDDQLDEYVGKLAKTDGLPPEQRDDLAAVVLPHLRPPPRPPGPNLTTSTGRCGNSESARAPAPSGLNPDLGLRRRSPDAGLLARFSATQSRGSGARCGRVPAVASHGNDRRS
jgi:hypothetical protein